MYYYTPYIYIDFINIKCIYWMGTMYGAYCFDVG